MTVLYLYYKACWQLHRSLDVSGCCTACRPPLRSSCSWIHPRLSLCTASDEDTLLMQRNLSHTAEIPPVTKKSAWSLFHSLQSWHTAWFLDDLMEWWKNHPGLNQIWQENVSHLFHHSFSFLFFSFSFLFFSFSFIFFLSFLSIFSPPPFFSLSLFFFSFSFFCVLLFFLILFFSLLPSFVFFLYFSLNCELEFCYNIKS